MSTEENKAIVHRFSEAWMREGALDVVDEIMAADYVWHGSDLSGIEAFKNNIVWWRTVFPDIHFVIEDMIAEGDRVAARYSCSGTHEADFAGVPATGKKVTWTAIVIFRYVDGKIAEMWVDQDALGRLQQIGAIPPLG
jgi:steroid delta-isomerase-like uncharacterized protein